MAKSIYKAHRLAEPADGSGRHFPLFLVSAAAVIALLISASLWFTYGYDGIYPGVSALDINGGFSSFEDFSSALAQKTDKMYDNEQIAISIGKSVYNLKVSDIGVTVNVPQTAADAYNYGRTGNYFERFGSITKSIFAGEDIPAKIDINSDALRTEVNRICSAVNSQMQQPYWIDGNFLYINTVTLGSSADTDELFGLVYDKLSVGDFSPMTYLSFVSDNNSVNYRPILEKIISEPKNAYIDKDADPSGATIAHHTNGISFDIDSALKQLETESSDTVKIPITITAPEITTEDLQAKAFRDLLAQCETTFNANLVGRTSNMKLAASSINGMILQPGEEFSFNGTVGERTAERGYKNAKVFQAGEVVDGLGGGICQISSTLYMAALRSNLKISERRNHMYAVAYTPIGQDATVVYGSTDFRFVNSLKYPIKIIIDFTDNTVIASFYGTNDTGDIVEITSSVQSKTPFQTVTVYDAELAPDKTNVVQSGYTGYRSVTYRTVYDANGNQLSHVLENTSTYRKLDKIVHSGDPSLAANASSSDIPAETQSTSASSAATQQESQSTAASSAATSEPTQSEMQSVATIPETSAPSDAEQSPIISIPETEAPVSAPTDAELPTVTSTQEVRTTAETQATQTEAPAPSETKSEAASTNRHSTFSTEQ